MNNDFDKTALVFFDNSNFKNNFDFKNGNKVLMINLETFQEGTELNLRRKL